MGLAALISLLQPRVPKLHPLCFLFVFILFVLSCCLVSPFLFVVLDTLLFLFQVVFSPLKDLIFFVVTFVLNLIWF